MGNKAPRVVDPYGSGTGYLDVLLRQDGARSPEGTASNVPVPEHSGQWAVGSRAGWMVAVLLRRRRHTTLVLEYVQDVQGIMGVPAWLGRSLTRRMTMTVRMGAMVGGGAG